jgi:outer membrane immunogenic protein
VLLADSFTVTQTVATNWLLTARPRAGFVMGNMLVYITGGLAETHIKYNEQFNDTFAKATESAVLKQNMSGWTVGGGVEYKFATRFSGKVEYLYADFGEVNLTSTNLKAFTPPISFPSNVFTHSASLHMHLLRFGVNYHF